MSHDEPARQKLSDAEAHQAVFPQGDPTPTSIAAGVMEVADQIKPLHEFLDGQRTHFLSQGYSDDEARAMAAAIFVSIFGTGITRTGGISE